MTGPAPQLPVADSGPPRSGHNSLDALSQVALSESITRDLGERYDLRGFVGRGGMATVWLAKDEVTGESVAIKRLEGQSGPARSFYRELSLLFRLTDPHVTRIQTVVEAASGTRYLILEYCPGGSLRSAMSRARAFDGELCPEPVVRRLVCEILDGLAAAHRLRVVHRDLKPENILLATPADRSWASIKDLRLTDFGLARTLGEAERPRDGRLTALSGSPAYMAPEQLAGRYGPSSDLYALGIIAYELFHGRLPFQGDIRAVMRAQVHETPEIDPQLPEPWPELLRSLLSKSMGERPESALALRARLGGLGEAAPAIQSAIATDAGVPDVVVEAGHPKLDGSAAIAAVTAAVASSSVASESPPALPFTELARFEESIEALLPAAELARSGGAAKSEALVQVGGRLVHIDADGSSRTIVQGLEAEAEIGLAGPGEGIFVSHGSTFDWLDSEGALRRRLELQFSCTVFARTNEPEPVVILLDGPRLLRLELNSSEPPTELQRLSGEGLRPIIVPLAGGAFGVLRGLRSPRLERYSARGYLRGVLRLPGPCWEVARWVAPGGAVELLLRCLVEGRFRWSLADTTRLTVRSFDRDGALRPAQGSDRPVLFGPGELRLTERGDVQPGLRAFRMVLTAPQSATSTDRAFGLKGLELEPTTVVRAADRLLMVLRDGAGSRLLVAEVPTLEGAKGARSGLGSCGGDEHA